MKRLLVLVAVCSSVAFAQEIGTEIAPAPNQAGPAPVMPSAQVPLAEAGPLSAGAGAFGIRGSFSGTTFSIPTASAGGGGTSVGVAYFASNGFKLLFDLGFGLASLGNELTYALNALVGFDLLFRSTADALRPFIHASAFFSLNGANQVVPGFGVQLGGGAEYFFSKHFSMNGRLLLAVPMALANGVFAIAITTVSPAVGATWYF